MQLDDTNAIVEFDQKKVLTSAKHIADQFIDGYKQAQELALPDAYQHPDQVIIVGMGGSHLGCQVISSVFDDRLTCPLIIRHDYMPPGYISQRSLIILTSYSGNTEEVLECAQKVREKNARIVCISTGGALIEFAKDTGIPHIVFDDSAYNPSSVPRYGSAYLLAAQLKVLELAKVISINQQEHAQISSSVNAALKIVDPSVLEGSNPAKSLARVLQEKAIMLITAQHLWGSAYIFKNHINESSKAFSIMHTLPELNHHLLEGMKHPEGLKDQLEIVMIRSDLYHPRTQARFDITKDIFIQMGYRVHDLPATSSTKISQAFEILTVGSFVGLYLAMLHKEDPGPNPWVDALKKELAKIH